MEIISVIESLNQLRESPDYELCQLSGQKAGVLDDLASERATLLDQESAELEKPAERLAEEIKEWNGQSADRIGWFSPLERLFGWVRMKRMKLKSTAVVRKFPEGYAAFVEELPVAGCKNRSDLRSGVPVMPSRGELVTLEQVQKIQGKEGV